MYLTTVLTGIQKRDFWYSETWRKQKMTKYWINIKDIKPENDEIVLEKFLIKVS